MIDLIRVPFPPSASLHEQLRAQRQQGGGDEPHIQTGRICGLKVRTSKSRTEVSGSVTKAIIGHNRSDVTVKQVHDHLTRLMMETGLQAKDGRVRRVEIGYVFKMQRHPVEYLNLIAGLPKHRLSRLRMKGDGCFLTNSRRTLVIYDKTASDDSRLRESVERNLLRVELRVGKHARTEFGLDSPITLGLLLEKSTMRRMLDALTVPLGNLRFHSGGRDITKSGV